MMVVKDLIPFDVAAKTFRLYIELQYYLSYLPSNRQTIPFF